MFSSWGPAPLDFSCAWWMSKRRDGSRILVVDEGEFAGGASGRNGAGFRMQWGLELNIRLCQESIRLLRERGRRARLSARHRAETGRLPRPRPFGEGA